MGGRFRVSGRSGNPFTTPLAFLKKLVGVRLRVSKRTQESAFAAEEGWGGGALEGVDGGAFRG